MRPRNRKFDAGRGGDFISPKSPQLGVNFVFTLAENQGITRIDGEEVSMISRNRRWS